MSSKTAGRVISFRVTDELAQAVDRAASESGTARSAWLMEAIMSRLGQQSENVAPESRLERLIGQMETLFSSAFPQHLYLAHKGDEPVSKGVTAKEVIAEMVAEAQRTGTQSSNKRIVARLIELGIRPARGAEWTTSMVDNLKRRMNKT